MPDMTSFFEPKRKNSENLPKLAGEWLGSGRFGSIRDGGNAAVYMGNENCLYHVGETAVLLRGLAAELTDDVLVQAKGIVFSVCAHKITGRMIHP